jgi:hypothetical protein
MTSITAANHTKEPKGAVPPPGKIAAGKANHLADPNWKKVNATTILRTLRSCGDQLRHLVKILGSVIATPSK